MNRFYELKPGYLRCYKSGQMKLLRAEVALNTGVKCTVEKNSSKMNGGGSVGANNEFLITISIPNGTANKNGIGELVLGTNSYEEAQDWRENLVQASLDGGENEMAPQNTTKKTKTKTNAKNSDNSLKETVHTKYQASFLSSDNPDRQSYRGFFNLVLIVCFISNIRGENGVCVKREGELISHYIHH
jgi:hypothetical protein